MLIPPSLDPTVLQHAATLAAGFSFGALEMWFEKFPSKWKPLLYIGLTLFLTDVAYIGLVSNNPLVQLFIATVGLATTATGGVSYVQNNVLTGGGHTWPGGTQEPVKTQD